MSFFEALFSSLQVANKRSYLTLIYLAYDFKLLGRLLLQTCKQAFKSIPLSSPNIMEPICTFGAVCCKAGRRQCAPQFGTHVMGARLTNCESATAASSQIIGRKVTLQPTQQLPFGTKAQDSLQ